MRKRWLKEVSRWLLAAGYERVDGEVDLPFGDVLIKFRGAACEVTVGRERLQWFVGISPRGGDPVMLPKIWACYLDGTEPDVENVEPLDTQLEFLYSRLREAEEASERDSQIGDKLCDINLKLIRARRARLGLEPGGQNS